MKITDLLLPQAIELGTAPATKGDAIEKLIALHDGAGNLSDVEAYRAAILAREEQGTTAIGEGMAIPHAKTDAVARPALAAITVPDGVDYEAPDGQPSKLIFMIAAPSDGEVHLEVLARLMTMTSFSARPRPSSSCSSSTRRNARSSRRNTPTRHPRPKRHLQRHPRPQPPPPPTTSKSSPSPPARPASHTPTWPPRRSRSKARRWASP